jgi:DNA-binding IclR family transcriptional regulator
VAPKNASQNVSRATRLLLALGAAGPKGLSLSDMANLLGDARPTIHRALVSMLETGFVAQRGKRSNYHLGPTIYALAQTTPTVPDLVQEMRPRLLAVTAQTGLSSFLMMRAGLDSVCVDMQLGRILASAMVEGIGGRVPLGLGIAGIVLLAQTEAAERATILKSNQTLLANQGLDSTGIEAEIQSFYLKGYAIGQRSGQGFSNLTMAFPIRLGGLPHDIAAVSVVAPDARTDEAVLTNQAEHIAKLLSA